MAFWVARPHSADSIIAELLAENGSPLISGLLYISQQGLADVTASQDELQEFLCQYLEALLKKMYSTDAPEAPSGPIYVMEAPLEREKRKMVRVFQIGARCFYYYFSSKTGEIKWKECFRIEGESAFRHLKKPRVALGE